MFEFDTNAGVFKHFVTVLLLFVFGCVAVAAMSFSGAEVTAAECVEICDPAGVAAFSPNRCECNLRSADGWSDLALDI